MKDMILAQWKPGMTPEQKLFVVREFLQVLCLRTLSQKGWFEHMAFLGGTSLRILYDLRRYSEDLDFSQTADAVLDAEQVSQDLVREFTLCGFKTTVKLRTVGAIRSMMLKVSGLMKELGLAAMEDQNLSIKLEVDTRPPAGWKLSRSIVQKYFMFPVTHYDLPSLYAGKLHACFFRVYTKGRDIYDWIWYLGRKVSPNFELLNHAIQQTHPGEHRVDESNFKSYAIERLKRIDFVKARNDVERFLEDKSELALFDEDLMKQAIERAK